MDVKVGFGTKTILRIRIVHDVYSRFDFKNEVKQTGIAKVMTFQSTIPISRDFLPDVFGFFGFYVLSNTY